MRVARFTSTQQQSCLRRHSILNGKVHLPFSSQPSYFLPLTFNLKILSPSYDVTILSPQHLTISTNTACHSQLIYIFIQTQHEHQICRSFSVFLSCTPHIAHTMDLSFLRKIPFSLSFRHHASPPCSIAGLR